MLTITTCGNRAWPWQRWFKGIEIVTFFVLRDCKFCGRMIVPRRFSVEVTSSMRSAKWTFFKCIYTTNWKINIVYSVAMQNHVWTLETARRSAFLKWQIRIWSYADQRSVNRAYRVFLRISMEFFCGDGNPRLDTRNCTKKHPFKVADTHLELCSLNIVSSVVMQIHVWTLETAGRSTLLKWQMRIWSYAHQWSVNHAYRVFSAHFNGILQWRCKSTSGHSKLQKEAHF